ncbi:MAG: FecR family protein [Sphingobacterium sp.]
MSRNSNRIKNKLSTIFQRYVKGEASAEEERFVERFYQQIGQQKEGANINFDRLEQEIKQTIDNRISSKNKVIKLGHNPYIRLAACLLLVCTAAFIIFRMSGSEGTSESLQTVQVTKENPILSIGAEKSYDLDEDIQDSLAYRFIDDQKVFLLSALTEEIADDAPRKITNPTKKVFTFLLDDGSQVWLNAHSSIEFTPNFNKTERVVHVSGEVSLDVAKREQDGKPMPFFVKTPLQTVEVLGTQFSVNTQEVGEESVVLLEGKIKLEHNVYKTSVVLAPNQKAFLSTDNNRILVASADENNKVRAWRKGLFHFEGERVADVMKELAQWYEQPIQVSPAVRNLPITGMITRYEQLTDVLQIIEMTNNITFVEKKGVMYVTANE